MRRPLSHPLAYSLASLARSLAHYEARGSVEYLCPIFKVSWMTVFYKKRPNVLPVFRKQSTASDLVGGLLMIIEFCFGSGSNRSGPKIDHFQNRAFYHTTKWRIESHMSWEFLSYSFTSCYDSWFWTLIKTGCLIQWQFFAFFAGQNATHKILT